MSEALPATSMSLDGKQLLIIIISAICIILTVLGACVRTYGRVVVLRKLFVEDVFMLFATIIALGLSTVCITGASYGFGKHNVDLTNSTHLRFVRQTPIVAAFLWIGAALLAKVSVLFFYHRLDQRKPMRWTVYSLMFLVIAQNLSLVFIFSSYCFPKSALWPESAASGGERWRSSTIQWYLNANGISAAVIDAAIFVTPLFMLHHLAISKSRKYLVGAQFAMAALPILAGCLRCYFTWDLITSSDPLYDLVNAIVCAQVEVHLAIFCGSSSCFNVLLKAWGWLPCNRPSTSIGSLPTMPGPWPMDDKVEQVRWHDWRLPTSELSADAVMEVAHQRNFGRKEPVINANSPRDAPRIVLDKRRYTDVSSVPSQSRRLGSEYSAMTNKTLGPSNTRGVSTPNGVPGHQFEGEEDRVSCGSLLSPKRSSFVKSGPSLHFFVDEGQEGKSAVSARAIVRFPSVNDRSRNSNSSRPTERAVLERRLTASAKDEWPMR